MDDKFEIDEIQKEIEEQVAKLNSTIDEKEKKKLLLESQTKLRRFKHLILNYKKKANTENNEIFKNVIKNNSKIWEEFCGETQKNLDIIKYTKNTDNIQNNSSNHVNVNKMTCATQVLAVGIDINKDTLASIRRSEKLVSHTEEIGNETLQQIGKQTETIVQIDKTLDELDGNLVRAKKDVAWFFRQIAGDKICIFVFALIIIILIFIVFFAIYKKKN